MKIYRGSFLKIPELEGSWAVTLGTFDGVHRGHAAIFAAAVDAVHREKLTGALAITFGRHPRAVLTPRRRPRMLTTLEERIALLRTTGLERLYVLDFEENLQVLEYDEFVRFVLRDRLGLGHFILGHDVHFGRGRRGTSEAVGALAKEMGFAFSQVASVEHEGSAISSSRIRDAIEGGKLDKACAMLGHPYLVWGPVVGGRQVGRHLGFPTANLRVTSAAKLLPPGGVYAVWAKVAGESCFAPAVLNLGTAPTFDSPAGLRLEVHLLEGSPELYEKRLMVAFGPRLRAEKRFASPEELARQIARDVDQAAAALAAVPKEQSPATLGSSFALSGGEDPPE